MIHRSQAADADVAEPELLTVMLEYDMPFAFLHEARFVGELALLDERGDLVAAPSVFDDLLAVEPVFDVVALDDEPCLIEFADGFGFLFRVGGDQGVERAGGGLRVFAVAVLVVLGRM